MEFLAGVLAAAERANAAYEIDPRIARARFEGLGQEWVGQYSDGGLQAALTMREGAAYLSISGTRFGEGLEGLQDLEKDLDVTPRSIGRGMIVANGAWEGLFDLWRWVFTSIPSSAAVWVEGHSLGAWRTYYSPVFCPSARLAGMHCFESPKAANAAFWTTYDHPDTVSTVHGQDIFFGYPFLTTWGASQPPRNHLWLHDGSLESILPEQWPEGFSVADHSMDAVAAALRALVPAA